MKIRAVTLLYHDVVPDSRWELSGFSGADADVYKMDCADFRRHLRAIADNLGVKPATGPELLAGKVGDRPFFLTFDDGGESAARWIADMLDELGWKAHFFVTAGRIDTPGFVSRAQIKELQQRGHVVGSHSYSHPPRMAHCSAAQLDDEWQSSAKALSEILGAPVTTASVPGGFYSRQVAKSAARAGIKVLFNSEPVTTSQLVDGCMVLGRFSAQRATPPGWAGDIVAGRLQPRMRAYLFWNAKKVAKALGGTVWLKARVLLLEKRAHSKTPPTSNDSG